MYFLKWFCKQKWFLLVLGFVSFCTLVFLNFNYAYGHETLKTSVDDGEYIITANCSWSRVLDNPSASKEIGNPLNIYTYNNTNAQIYEIKKIDGSFYIIKNKASGLVLDVDAGRAASGTKVQQYSYNGTDAQKWNITECAGGYNIKSALGNFVLDVAGAIDQDGTKISIYTPNGSDAQKWKLTPKGQDVVFADAPLVDSSYVLAAKAATLKALDVSCGSKTPGANIQIYSGNRTPAQTFSFSHDKHGYYTIKNLNSGLCLDVNGAGTANATNVQQYTSNGSLAQKWIICKNSDGSYLVCSALKKDFVLDLYGASNIDGANVDVYSLNNSNAQKWLFYDPNTHGAPGLHLVEDGWYNICENGGLVADVVGRSRNSNTPLQLYTKNNSLAQVFYFDWCSDKDNLGWYRIYVGCGEGLALAIDDGSLFPGTLCVTEDATKDDSLWSVVDDGVNRYLINKASGLYLSVEDNKAVSGSKLVGSNVNFARSWTMKTTEIINPGIYSIVTGVDNLSVVDVPGASLSDKTNLQIYSSNKSLAQKWRLISCNNGHWALQCLSSGFWLAENNGNACQKKADNNKNPDETLQWDISILKGFYCLKHVKTNKVLDLSGASANPGNKIVLYKSNESIAQCWDLVGANLLDDGIYSINVQRDINKCIDVTNGSFKDHEALQMYESNNSGAQAFHIYNHSDGTISMKNAKSKKFIDVPDAAPTDNKRIQQFMDTVSVAQRFVLQLTDDCMFYIKCKSNPSYVLDASSCDNASPLVSYHFVEGNDCQKFTFRCSGFEEVNWCNGVQFVPQNPELPWGCESVALTELLMGIGYYGGKTYVADHYIPYSDWDFVNCFAGDPYRATGIGCTMPPCIANSCNNFLHERGNCHNANVATGTSMQDLIDRVCAGYPSVIWVTTDMALPNKYGTVLYGYQAWTNLHAVCLCGYNAVNGNVIVADPLYGMVERNRIQLENIYNCGGCYSVTVD